MSAFQQRANGVIAMLQRGDHRGSAQQFVETVALGPGMWQQLPEAMRETFVFNAPTWLDEVQEPAAMTMDLTQLAGFDRPTLLTKGAQSPLFGRVMEKTAGALPHHRQNTFAGAGHVPHLTHPDDYVRVVTRFVLRSVMPG